MDYLVLIYVRGCCLCCVCLFFDYIFRSVMGMHARFAQSLIRWATDGECFPLRYLKIYLRMSSLSALEPG